MNTYSTLCYKGYKKDTTYENIILHFGMEDRHYGYETWTVGAGER